MKYDQMGIQSMVLRSMTSIPLRWAMAPPVAFPIYSIDKKCNLSMQQM